MCSIKLLVKTVLPFFLGVLCAVPRGSQADENSPFPVVRVIIYGDGSPGPYTVGRDFIEGSASIDTTSVDSPVSIVESDSNAGTVTFDRLLSPEDSVAVTFAAPPSWLKKTYRRSPQTETRGTLPAVSDSPVKEKIPRQFPGLSFNGSKTFDVNVGGDREAALNQTLRLNITGKLTDDITLKAAISDQNVPISPEGDTRELEELDRVMIELQGRNFNVDMGDTDLRHDGGRWLSYERRLSGARASIKTGGLEIFGSGAVSEGRHMSITITPVEGNQGPYRLFTENGEKTISLIPGTETLWINGEQLTRGTYNDYTIDYTTGEIIFTEQRIIGSDMRIVCDYEYTSESYRRNFYSAGINGAFLNNRLKMGAVISREEDDASKYILEDLDDTMRKALSLSGDSPAVIDGIRPASEDSTGTYDRVQDHLVYNPAGKGEYSAVFSWVGENRGTYRYLGGGIYEYVPPEQRGPGSGASYDPVSVINGPVSHDLTGINVSYTPLPFVHITSELAGSSVDRNTLSGIDDSDNAGGAGHIGVTVSPEIKTAVPLKLELSGNFRSQESAFAPLDRDRAAEENRLWGLPLITANKKETVSEFSGGITMNEGKFAGSGFTVNGGQAEFGGSGGSKRTGGLGRFLIRDRGAANITLNHIEREDVPDIPGERIDRVNFKAYTLLGGFRPSFVFESEQAEKTGDNTRGTSYNDFLTGLKMPEFFGLNGECEWFYRKERAKRISWTDSSFARGGSIEFTSGQKVSGMFRAKYSRRERITGPHRAATDQAIIDYFYRPAEGIIKLDGSYRAGRSREASKRKNYIYTGEDRGSYRWEDENGDGVRDPDEFIPDEHGAYYLYEETLEDYRPVNIVSAYGRLGIDVPPALFRKTIGAGIAIRTETTFDINEKSSAPTSDVFLLNLSQFRKQGKTTSGDARFQEDVTVPISEGNGSVRLRFFRSDSYNAEYVTGAERRGEKELSLRLRLPVRENSDAEITVRHALLNRTMENTQSGDYRVRSVSGDTGLSLYPAFPTKLGMNIGFGFDRDKLSSIEALYFSVKPSATFRFSGRGRIETSYAVTSVKLNNFSGGMRLPYTVARGRKEGKNHDISVVCDYRLSHSMNVIVTYTGRKFGGKDFENFARAQIRALF